MRHQTVGFIKVFSRKAIGFHRQAKLFWTELLCEKNFPPDGLTRQAKSASQSALNETPGIMHGRHGRYIDDRLKKKSGVLSTWIAVHSSLCTLGAYGTKVIFETKDMSHVSFLCFPLQGLIPLKSQGTYKKVLSFLQQEQSSRIVLNSLECSYTLCLLGEFIGLVKNSTLRADGAWKNLIQWSFP